MIGLAGVDLIECIQIMDESRVFTSVEPFVDEVASIGSRTIASFGSVFFWNWALWEKGAATAAYSDLGSVDLWITEGGPIFRKVD